MSLERLESLKKDMQKCVGCSLCKIIPMPTIKQNRFISACPAVDEYHSHAYSGGGISVMALSLLDGRIEADEDMANILAACTTCGACDVSCKFIMAAERQQIIIALKEYLHEQGFSKKDEDPQEKLTEPWFYGLNLKILPNEKSKILLLVGSGANYHEKHASTARKLAILLRQANVDYGILRDEPNAGIKYYSTGQRKNFINQAQKLNNLIEETGVKTIITLCAEDFGMLRSKYPHYGITSKNKILHASEFLYKLVKKKKIKFVNTIEKQVTYHDPCYLGRQSEPVQVWEGEERQSHGVMKYFVPKKKLNYGGDGVFDEPRKIIQRIPGLHFVEMHRIREYSYCCGGGGEVPNNHPNVAESAALQRIDEAQDVKADLLVTSCQHCRYNLTFWQKENPLPVIDLVDLVYEATGLQEEK